MPDTAKGRPKVSREGIRAMAEEVEESKPTKGNVQQAAALRTLGRAGVSTGLLSVRAAARRDKRTRFTALLHHVNLDLLRDSFYKLKKQAAPGVDGVTWWDYEVGLEERLRDLHDRVHRGSYRARPSRRTYIPKPDGRQRPLGIAAVEDKIVQQALVTVLNQIYEVDFEGFSYGSRPERHQHHALDALWVGVMRKKVNWVLDADIRGFFDAIDHGWLLKFLEHRIANWEPLAEFRKQVCRSWLDALRRRSQRNRMTWKRLAKLADLWLPPVRILHPMPYERFDAMYPR